MCCMYCKKRVMSLRSLFKRASAARSVVSCNDFEICPSVGAEDTLSMPLGTWSW